jgi:hypothetical protein
LTGRWAHVVSKLKPLQEVPMSLKLPTDAMSIVSDSDRWAVETHAIRRYDMMLKGCWVR